MNKKEEKAWKNFIACYRLFKISFDKTYPEDGKILNEYFKSNKDNDEADWWKK